MPSSNQNSDTTQLPPAQRWIEVALILLVFFAVAGDPAPAVNEPHYLARLKHFWNPEWCEGDTFLESPDTQLVFIWLFGWLTRILPLAAVAWIGRLAAWGLIAWAWQRLSGRLIPCRYASVLSAALFVTFINTAHLAGEWVVGGVEAKCFAYGLVIAALREMIDSRWSRVWLLLGGAMAFHPLVGGWCAILCGTIWLVEERSLAALRSMVPGLVGGALLALPGVVPALALTWGSSPDVVAEANQIYVFERLAHHLALLHLPSPEVRLRLARHGALLAGLALLALWLRREMRVARADDTVTVDTAGLRRIGLIAWGAVVLALVGFAIELVFWNDPATAAALLKYYWFRTTDFAAAMGVSLYIAAVLAVSVARRRWWGPWLLFAAMAGAGAHLGSVVLARWENPVPPADRKMQDPGAWQRACEWVDENLPDDATFLTPRLASSFKWRTGRREVATQKDIPQNAAGIVEWRRRLRDIFYVDIEGREMPLRSLAQLPSERLRQIVDDYQIDYIIAEGDIRLPFPAVYPERGPANEPYVIYQTRD